MFSDYYLVEKILVLTEGYLIWYNKHERGGKVIKDMPEKDQIKYYKQLCTAYKRDLNKIIKSTPGAKSLITTNEIVNKLWENVDLTSPITGERFIKLEKAIAIVNGEKT